MIIKSIIDYRKHCNKLYFNFVDNSMRKLIPTYDNLKDESYAGMFFKDEGDFLTVKFEKDTKKPAGNGLYPFGSLQTTAVTKAELDKMTSLDELRAFLLRQL